MFIDKPKHGDEYYTPQNAVDMILPYIPKDKTIWCPFDRLESKFVQTFIRGGWNVEYGHIETGQDFFDYDKPLGDIVVSNPPFSKKDAVLKKLYEMNVKFALILPLYGVFDSKTRSNLFRENGVELLVPYGRMKFSHKDFANTTQPNFQSAYVCHGLLDKQIVFTDDTF